eukprot:5774458-Prymnesium_polylepis.1
MAKMLQSADVTQHVTAVADARAAATELLPLLQHQHFPTTVTGGAPLKDAAISLGRTSRGSRSLQQLTFGQMGAATGDLVSGCSTAGPQKPDGGIVPLLEAELPTAPEVGEDSVVSLPAQLAKTLTCVALKLEGMVERIERGREYGKGKLRWAGAVDVAKELVDNIAAARADRVAAGWPRCEQPHFNAE